MGSPVTVDATPGETEVKGGSVVDCGLVVGGVTGATGPAVPSDDGGGELSLNSCLVEY